MGVFANDRRIIHKGLGCVITAALPDVCKTPSPGGPIPIPYVNIAKDSDLTAGTKSVKIEGNMVAHQAAKLALSTGDEGGTAGGGIISSKIKGRMKWSMQSTDVKFEGEGVVRFLDPTLHNGNSDNTMHPTEPTDYNGTYPGMKDEQVCPECGEQIAAHRSNFEVPQSEETKKDVKSLSNAIADVVSKDKSIKGKFPLGLGAMMGVMHVQCGGKVIKLAAYAGPPIAAFAAVASGLGFVPVPPMTPEAWAKKYPTHGRGVKPDGKPAATPGACAAPRMHDHVRTNMPDCKVLAMSEAWSSAKKKGKHAHTIESCPTCKINLPRMLCNEWDLSHTPA